MADFEQELSEYDGGVEPPLGETDAYRMAVKLLARREHSAAELAGKLAARGVPTEVLEALISRLVDERLQSDTRFAEAYIRLRSGKGYGPLRIQQELQARGVADETVKQGLSECETDWYALAGEVRHKRFGAAMPQDYREKARQMRFLQYRGFDNEHIQATLDWD